MVQARSAKQILLALAATIVIGLLAAGWPAVTHASTTVAATAELRGPVDINTANADELVKLPGIGETMAKRIVEFRKQHGPFKRVEDLMKVKGIGERSFEKLRPAITVGRPGAK